MEETSPNNYHLTNNTRLFPHQSPLRLTVWCKSLLFHGNGYTVFDDSDGRIVFRVDNYAPKITEMALMDPTGHVLLTICHCKKMLRLAESWKIYEGDRDSYSSMLLPEPLVRVRKDLCSSTCTASASASMASGGHGGSGRSSGFRLSWSRCEEWSKIHRLTADHEPLLVAQINRKFSNSKKNLLDEDVLTLTMQPGMDPAMVMALIMITNSNSMKLNHIPYLSRITNCFPAFDPTVHNNC